MKNVNQDRRVNAVDGFASKSGGHKRARLRPLALTLLLIVSLVFTAGVNSGEVYAVDPLGWPTYDEINVESFCVIDAATKDIILSKNPDKKRANASTTKIMTALLLVEDDNFDQERLLTVSNASLFFLDPNSARLKELKTDDKLRTIDCLAALLLASANDVARVIAQNYGGAYGAIDPGGRHDASVSQDLFVARMNQRAVELGATGTHFTNPAGFDEADGSHYTTTHDLALISAQAMDHPVIAQICAMQYHRMPTTDEHPTAWWGTMSNSNGLVLYGADFMQSQYFERYTGVKTGTTPQAGKCLVGSGITTDGRQLICAAMGITSTTMDSNPWLARALPVRAILEEAARLEGVPVKEDKDLFASAAQPSETDPAEPLSPLNPVETQAESLTPEPYEDDPFFAGGLNQTDPVILVLAALGLLAILAVIVIGSTILIRKLMKRRENTDMPPTQRRLSRTSKNGTRRRR
ncbi:MAG TPA: hypothetical protein VFD19_01385 [Clostridia bacterium]|nr:hypothetical protein [Clostridia bacterium]